MTDIGNLLRTGAQHIRRYGWRDSGFGNRESGMCLHGGIYSAVIEANAVEYRKPERYHKFDVVDIIADREPVECDDLSRQGDRAVIALAPLIPSIPGCRGCELLEDSSFNSHVYHYNDVHCTGGEDAALLLEQAAEKWEADR